MKKLYRFSLPLLVLSVVGAFIFASVAHATGEDYVYSGTGSNKDGLGSDSITASSGAFKSDTVFKKIAAPASSTGNLISGYTYYYSAPSANFADGASEFPGCRNVKAFIALKANYTSGFLYVDQQSSNCTQIGLALTNLVPTNDADALPSDGTISIKPNTADIQNQAYAKALAPVTDSLKTAYYTALGSKAPCSSQGCNDTTWNQWLGECWAQARGQAADSARYQNQGVASGGQPYDMQAGTTQLFASCLSGHTGSYLSENDINAYLKIHSIDYASINKAGDDAASAAEDKFNAGNNGPSTPPTSSCAIPGGIGWIVCPVFNFLAGVLDGTYGIIEGLLQTHVQILDPNSGTHNGWVIAEAVANVGLVIVFLIIIFSQLSSVGVSNYGVKKMLPRIIIAAILINASFIVCQIAVDISNILGTSLKDVLDNLPVFNGKTAKDVFSTANLFSTITVDILAIQAGAVAVAGAVAITIFTGVGLLIPILLGGLIAVAVTFLILIARQAIIVLLIVLAPLAFLAMLLPNTEQYFKQWRKMFVAMLMLFPLVALLYGGARVAAAILTQALVDVPAGQLVANAVLVVPLIATPILLKGSLNAIPIVGNLATKLQNRANGFAGNRAKQFAKSTPIARGLAIRKQARENYRTEKFAKSVDKGGIGRLMASGFGITEAGKRGNEALARNAAGILNEAEEKEIRNSDARLGNMRTGTGANEKPLTTAQLMQIYRGKHVTDNGIDVGEKGGGNVLINSGEFKEYDRIAAVQRAAAVANVGEANKMLDATSDPGMSATLRKFAGKALATSSVASKMPWLGGETVARVEAGGTTAADATFDAIKKGKVTAEVLAGGDDASASYLAQLVAPDANDAPEIAAQKAQARASLKGEADKIYAEGSRLGERVTTGSVKESTIASMRQF